MIREKEHAALPGLPVLIALILVAAASLWALITGANTGAWLMIGSGIVLLVLSIILMFGVFTVNPNEARVLQFFGAYIGSAKTAGLRWANPLFTKKRISLRIRNFESGKLKVNDNEGNPIEIAAVVVWKVVDTAEAVFQVDDYNNYVKVQSESALRNLATSYVYDAHDEAQMSLRGNTADVAEHL